MWQLIFNGVNSQESRFKIEIIAHLLDHNLKYSIRRTFLLDFEYHQTSIIWLRYRVFGPEEINTKFI